MTAEWTRAAVAGAALCIILPHTLAPPCLRTGWKAGGMRAEPDRQHSHYWRLFGDHCVTHTFSVQSLSSVTHTLQNMKRVKVMFV